MLPKDSFAFKLFDSYYSGGAHDFCCCQEGSGAGRSQQGRPPAAWGLAAALQLPRERAVPAARVCTWPLPLCLLFPAANGHTRQPSWQSSTTLSSFQKHGRPGAFSQQLGLVSPKGAPGCGSTTGTRTLLQAGRRGPRSAHAGHRVVLVCRARGGSAGVRASAPPAAPAPAAAALLRTAGAPGPATSSLQLLAWHKGGMKQQNGHLRQAISSRAVSWLPVLSAVSALASARCSRWGRGAEQRPPRAAVGTHGAATYLAPAHGSGLSPAPQGARTHPMPRWAPAPRAAQGKRPTAPTRGDSDLLTAGKAHEAPNVAMERDPAGLPGSKGHGAGRAPRGAAFTPRSHAVPPGKAPGAAHGARSTREARGSP